MKIALSVILIGFIVFGSVFLSKRKKKKVTDRAAPFDAALINGGKHE